MDWSVPDEEISAFINDRIRPIGTYLCGRKMYETMLVWQTPEVIPGLTPAMRDFARIWQAADKVVYSKSLQTVSTPKTRLEREFEPQAVRRLKAQLRTIFRWRVRTWPHRRSGPGSSTSMNCSSSLLCWAAASRFCRATSASSWISWTSAVLVMAGSISAIARGTEDTAGAAPIHICRTVVMSRS